MLPYTDVLIQLFTNKSFPCKHFAEQISKFVISLHTLRYFYTYTFSLVLLESWKMYVYVCQPFLSLLFSKKTRSYIENKILKNITAVSKGRRKISLFVDISVNGWDEGVNPPPRVRNCRRKSTSRSRTRIPRETLGPCLRNYVFFYVEFFPQHFYLKTTK